MLVCVTVTILFASPPARAASPLTDQEAAYLKAHGPVVFVSQSQYAPFEFISDQGAREGMSIELARWIATEFGFKATFVDTSFADAQKMIQARSADVLTSFFYSEKRDRLFDFSEPMFFIPATIFVAIDRPDIKDINDLEGKTIAIQRGDYAYDYLLEQKIKFNVIFTDDFAEATEKVVQGTADAVIGDEQIVLYYLFSHDREDRLKRVGKPLYVGDNSMAVVEGDKELLSILNKGILLAKEHGVLGNINKIWLGSPLAQKQDRLDRYRWPLGLAIFVFVALLAGTWMWNVNLRHEVQHRTRELLDSERFLDTVIEHIPSILFVKDAETEKIVRINRAGEIFTGYDRETLYGKSEHDLFPEKVADSLAAKDREVFASRQPVEVEKETIPNRRGEKRHLRTIKIPIFEERNRLRYLLGISEDITDQLKAEEERQRGEEALKAALKEKETLLKEIHHRVKNNMQVISSLLNLQLQTITEPELRDIFNEATGRIRVMSLVHESLYQTDSFTRISAMQYLRNLTSQLSDIFVGSSRQVSFEIDVENVFLSVEEAVPFGLIVTEIVTNAMKYAFQDSVSPGTVGVSLREKSDASRELRIWDDGAGLPEAIDPRRETTLGMRLIRDLAHGQLEGEWQVQGDNGVVWTITWPFKGSAESLG